MKSNVLENRSSEEVFEDHLHLARMGKLEEDLSRNISKDIMLLTNYGNFEGHEGVRAAAELLDRQLPEGKFSYHKKICHKNICYLIWTGDSKTSSIPHGTDSFLIENGKISIQTIFYIVNQK